MKKQIQIYSLDTRAFYTDEERIIHDNISWAKGEKFLLHEYMLFNSIVFATQDKLYHKFKNFEEYKAEKKNNKYFRTYVDNFLKDERYKEQFDICKKAIKNNSLFKILEKYISMQRALLRINLNPKYNKNSKYKKLYPMVRKLNPKSLTKYNKISVFESSFTRTLDLKINETTTDIFIIKVTDKLYYPIMEQLVNNSFTFLGDKYIALTATAGQIRLKKVIFIRESVYKKYEKTFMCGLSIDDINKSELKGCNVNKFLAYLGLIFSDSDKWVDFDINKAIVIDDFETNVHGWVDFIDNKTFEVTPTKMDVPIMHSDGCGWILPSESKVNFQFRAPWCKGLLTLCNYLLYCEKFNNGNYEVVDIYGKTWDLKKDDIKYVFSKSQFKMWKYYPNILNEDGTVKTYGWDTYKENFTKNNCHASKCHEETGDIKLGRFNYQMCQTLTDIREDELEQLIKPTKDLIINAYTDIQTMLKILGAGKLNKNKDYFQQALNIYPELLHEYHTQKKLQDSISAKRKDAKFSRINIDAKSTFIIPDVYAWLQYTFSADKSIAPKGLLADGEVYCRLYKKSPKLLCNRSPALYKEHAVRRNVTYNRNHEWFCTDGLYASTHDLISKILQYDVDGDFSLVVGDPLLISIAEKNMKGVLPLYYEMGKAEPEIITNKSIYESINKAWRFGNIGKYSNTLTKFWNNYDENSDLDLAKVICSLNNFSIDAAKTKIMPPVPDEINKKIKELKESDLPYFMQFAKDNMENKVCDINESTVNRLCAKIEEIKIPVKDGTKNEKYDFSGVGKLKVAKLMHNSKIVINNNVIKKYDELNDAKSLYFMKANSAGLEKEEVATSIYAQIKADLLAEFPLLNVVDIVDMIIKNEFKLKHKKSFLFNCFGDIIVENLKRNIKESLEDGYILCSVCGKRTKKTGKNQTMCESCRKDKIKEKDRNRKKK